MDFVIFRGCLKTSRCVGAFAALVILSGCSALDIKPLDASQFDVSPQASSSQTSTSRTAPPAGYQPLDPAPVNVIAIGGVVPPPQDILDALPDETMRLAIGQIDISGNITYGPVALSAANSSYIVTVDYIKSNTHPLFVKKGPIRQDGSFAAYVVDDAKVADISLPVYIGVGLRVTATLSTKRAGINLGNLIAIGAAAQANQLTGTLVVQTLGLTGENISTALPIPSDVSVGSIQSAIQALGTMKAKLYDTSKTRIEPRVVGVYNNLGGSTSSTINGIISSVLAKPLDFKVAVNQRRSR
ncbi:hypothetical protein [Burkholderia sp. LMG 21824]|uniref:hypothetical protein n=1 Tax=Burkholderia sp. LMG 21824 TaxID=3158172 RepID=UPI003C2BFBA6